MVVKISSAVLQRIVNEANASPADEVCGLLFGTTERIDDARACRNVAADPGRRFEIDPAMLFAALRAMRAGGPTLIGHYHSHPSGSTAPSGVDAAHAIGDGALWLIVGRGAARLWRSDRPGTFVAVDLIALEPML